MYNNTRMLTGYHKTLYKSIVKYIQFCHLNAHFIGHLGYKMHNMQSFMHKCIKLLPFFNIPYNRHFMPSPALLFILCKFMFIYALQRIFLLLQKLSSTSRSSHKQRLSPISTENFKKNTKNFKKSVDFQKHLCYYNTRPCENDSFAGDHPSGCGGIGRRARFRF